MNKKIFFTSDTHFGSERTLELSKRPFKDTFSMDEEIIKLWNETVSKDDVVYHLGDFGNYEVLKRLNGEIHLILGNYERKDILEGKESIDSLLAYGFKSVSDYKYLNLEELGIDIENITFLKLVHEPSKCDKDVLNIFNLFGHIHGRQLCKKFDEKVGGLDVGVDGHHMRVVSLNDVKFFAEAILKYYDEEVFC